MIAALPMYDFGDLTAANDTLWHLIREGAAKAGLEAPATLLRGPDLWEIWQAPDLLLAQTCGYPFRARLHPKVALVGTPDYGLEGCGPGQYCSVFVARADDQRATLAEFDGTALAYNEPMSQSGWAAPQTEAARLGLRFPAGLRTGAHRATAQAIAEGRADLGALDAVTWRHLQRLDSVSQGLRVVARTAPTPGLPLITAQQDKAALLFDITAAAITALPDSARNSLGLRGLVRLPAADYLAVPNPPPP